MRRPQGYAVITTPGVPTQEFDTFTCKHCQRIVLVQPNRDMITTDGGFCHKCFGLICDTCAAKGVCTPFERQLEAEEARWRLQRQMGLV